MKSKSAYLVAFSVGAGACVPTGPAGAVGCVTPSDGPIPAQLCREIEAQAPKGPSDAMVLEILAVSPALIRARLNHGDQIGDILTFRSHDTDLAPDMMRQFAADLLKNATVGK